MSAFAEVVESSLLLCTAQTWQWDNFPALGHLVKISSEQQTTYGLVINIQIGSADPTRTAYAYQKTEAELKRDQPHIFEFLKTTFTILPVGYSNSEKAILHAVPRTPCKIHAFVQHCQQHDYELFFSKADFLHILLATQTAIPQDQILLALSKELYDRSLMNDAFVDDIARTYSLIGGGDYKKLKAFLAQL